MEIFDNVTKLVKDDLQVEITKDSKMSVAAACFSIYAYQELKKQLDNIDELRFIFTSPTFVSEKVKKEKREFYIPRIGREKSLYGTEFEVKLRNELTQRSIAKECTDWIKRKVTFKSNTTNENMAGFINVESNENKNTYTPMNGFTTVDIGCEKGNNRYNYVNKFEAPFSNEYIKLFNDIWNDKDRLQDVTDVVIDSISAVYKENSPEYIYFVTLYNIFNTFLQDISEDELPNEAKGFMESKIWNKLYDFQKVAVKGIISKLEKYNGCILADSVGLGKTFTALAVIKYYQERNKDILVLCPKKLSNNWNMYKHNYTNNPIAKDRLNYDVLFHTDLSREGGHSNDIDLDFVNWSNYDLVVIDESHNFRNGGEISKDGQKENRYLRLMNKVIKGGVKTKVLMLSATPVNNRFNDLRNQLALAYEGDPNLINDKLDTDKSIDEIFRNAQKAFNAWGKLEPEYRTTEALQKMLDFDFFDLLDNVTIARSRKLIEKYYGTEEIGKFPERLSPLSPRPKLTDLKEAINYNEIYENLMMLNLFVYTPSKYIFESKHDKYIELTHNKGNSLTQIGREFGIRRLMSINMLKRLESSVYSFRLTIERIQKLIVDTIATIDNYSSGSRVIELNELNDEEFDLDDQNTDIFSVGKKVKIDLADMDYTQWREHLVEDRDTLEVLKLFIEDITPDHDSKLQELYSIMDKKIEYPINKENRKVIIFTAFSDTAEYLYDNISIRMKEKYGINSALVTGAVNGKTTLKRTRVNDLNRVLACFSPISKDRDLIISNCSEDLDILIATDCISEGQNLQDCDFLVNYDIHWNPVRIIQRFGRIDRIGSKNEKIQLVNFWPDLTLDDYIGLKDRVETRMKITVMTSTGTMDDNPLSEEEKGDLEYRKKQLEKLKTEVVDLEDMSTGISIMDLGLNEFRLDLLEYVKNNSDIENAPKGMHAVVESVEEAPAGVIYILKNLNDGVNIDSQNRLHPFYMVYISDEGNIICNHLEPKKMLDLLRLLSRNKDKPNMDLCRAFNSDTKDGKNMKKYSDLLGEAIDSIINVKEESDIDSFFGSGETTFMERGIKGLEDFELICFMVVK